MARTFVNSTGIPAEHASSITFTLAASTITPSVASIKLFSDVIFFNYLQYKNGVPDWNRTNDLSLRRRSLYPTELREHNIIITYLIFYNNIKGSLF